MVASLAHYPKGIFAHLPYMPKRIKETVMKFKEQGIEEQHFDRIRKKVYGDYVVEYNSVGDIARMFLADNMKEINSFDYIEEYETVTKQYVEEILKDVFKEEAADAALAASLFHYNELTISQIKTYLKEEGIPVRI